MILAYHRPDTIEKALALLLHKDPLTLPLGGGRILSRPEGLRATPLLPEGQSFSVVDIQDLHMDRIEYATQRVVVGGATRLRDLLTSLESTAPLYYGYELAAMIRHEFNPNLAAAATAAGALVTATGQSTYAACLMALDATCDLSDAFGRQIALVSDLLGLRKEYLRHRLITHISLPMAPIMACEFIARSPADKPLVLAAVAQWSTGRTRVVVGGWGTEPLLAMDSGDIDDAGPAAREAAAQSGDAWASAEYRMAMLPLLVERCLARFGYRRKG